MQFDKITLKKFQTVKKDCINTSIDVEDSTSIVYLLNNVVQTWNLRFKSDTWTNNRNNKSPKSILMTVYL